MPAATKLDLFKLHAAEYAAARRPSLVATRPGRYLTIQGKGAPGGAEFRDKVGALYGIAYAIKMAQKRNGRDFKVAMLEGLWWGVGKTRWNTGAARELWRWKLLIRVPGFVTPRSVAMASRMLVEKGKPKTVRDVRLETIDEGRCVQALHVGSYASETTTIGAMERVAKAEGVRFTGRHHEIYLSDPGRVKPEKLRTILRHPVR